MKHFIVFIIAMMSFINTATANESKLRLQVLPAGDYITFRLTPLVDQITINEVIVNRGACNHWSFGDPKPGTVLKYGQSKDWKLMIYNRVSGSEYPCDILEIVIKTPDGVQTFTRNN